MIPLQTSVNKAANSAAVGPTGALAIQSLILETLAGMIPVKTGAVKSCISKFAVVVEALPQSSVAVNVTVAY